jgi:hypothetical protein
MLQLHHPGLGGLPAVPGIGHKLDVDENIQDQQDEEGDHALHHQVHVDDVHLHIQGVYPQSCGLENINTY